MFTQGEKYVIAQINDFSYLIHVQITYFAISSVLTSQMIILLFFYLYPTLLLQVHYIFANNHL